MTAVDPEWVVAPDGGRPQGRFCAHLAEITTALDGVGSTTSPVERPSDFGCARCRAAGAQWVHLRSCLSCGHVGCCDSSRGQHAWAHAEATGHPLARSAEDGEHWAWCYVDEVFLVPAARPGGAPPNR